MKDWLERRYRWRDLLAELLQPPLPRHRSSWQYGLGGALVFLLLVQVVTGALLMVYYVPSPEQAHASVEFLRTRVPLGAVVRSVHAWASHLLIGGLVLHLGTTFAMRAYRRPRELTWVSGLLTFGLVLAIVFFGRVLPQDETAHYGSLIGVSLVEKTPLVGAFLGRLVKGGEFTGALTLNRFYAFHTVILPLLVALLQAGHLAAVHRQGLSVPPRLESRRAELTTLPFADYLPRQLLVWVFLANVLVILALFFPTDLGTPADPLAPIPPGIRPEWYFWPLYQMHRVLPPRLLGLEGEVVFNGAVVALAAALLALPFWDRAARQGRAGRGVTAFGLAVALTLAGFFVWSLLD